MPQPCGHCRRQPILPAASPRCCSQPASSCSRDCRRGAARIRTRIHEGRAGESAEGLASPPRGKDAAREKAVAKAKEAVAAALRAERSAEQHARREEFEAARTAREADRAASDLAKAQAALEAAQEAVEKAERDAETATRKKDAAARRMRETAESLAAAKIRSEAAQATLTRT